MSSIAFTEVLELGATSEQLFEHMTHPDTAPTVEMRPPFGFRTISRLIRRTMHRGVLDGCERLLRTFGPLKT